MSNYLLPTVYHYQSLYYQVRPTNLCPQHGGWAGGGGGGDGDVCCHYLDTCQCRAGPGCLTPGRREDWTVCPGADLASLPARSGQLRPSGESRWWSLVSLVVLLLLSCCCSRVFILSHLTRPPVNTQIMAIKTNSGIVGDLLRHLADHFSILLQLSPASHFLSPPTRVLLFSLQSRLSVLQG